MTLMAAADARMTEVVSHRGGAVSRHLRVVNARGRQPAIYHELFGNLTLVDHALADVLTNQGSAFFSDGDLRCVLGDSTYETLWLGHFIVENTEEERHLIDRWLEEREQSVPSGALVGALQISGSNACNFACSYCFADSSDGRSPKRQEIASAEPNISFETAVRAIDQILELARVHDKPGIVVKFLGREPLVNWQVIQQLLEHYQTARIQWAITTNGSLLTSDIAAALERFGVTTVVSLDGPRRINDAFRTFHSGNGTYERVCAKIRLMREAGAQFSINSVLSSATDLDSLKAFADDAVSWGASQIEFTLAMQTELVQLQRRCNDIGELARRLVDLYDHVSRLVPVYGDCFDPFHRILSTHKFRNESEICRPLGAGCSASSHQLSLEPTGDLFPCRAMSTHYGSINDLSDALRSDAYKRVAMRTFFNVPACHGCELEGFCQGTCLGSSEQAFGDIYQPEPQNCEVYRMTTSLLLERYCETH